MSAMYLNTAGGAGAWVIMLVSFIDREIDTMG